MRNNQKSSLENWVDLNLKKHLMNFNLRKYFMNLCTFTYHNTSNMKRIKIIVMNKQNITIQIEHHHIIHCLNLFLAILKYNEKQLLMKKHSFIPLYLWKNMTSLENWLEFDLKKHLMNINCRKYFMNLCTCTYDNTSNMKRVKTWVMSKQNIKRKTNICWINKFLEKRYFGQEVLKNTFLV